MKTTIFFNLFLISSSIIGVIFSITLFFSKNGRDKSMLYLNALLLTFTLNNFQSWILAKDLFQFKFKVVYLQFPWHFLSAPFFYMFLVHYLQIANKRPKILKFFFPLFFVLCFLQISFVVWSSNIWEQEKLITLYEQYTSTEETISLVTTLCILGYSLYILIKKEKLFTQILSYDNLKWLHSFFILIAIGCILWAIALTAKVVLNFEDFIVSYYPLRVFTTLLIFWLGINGIKQITLIKERKKLRYNLRNDNIPLENDSKEFTIEYVKIRNYIINNNKFTEVKLTRAILAKELQISVKKLSHLININEEQSFTDFINILRINYAKKLLTNPAYKNYTITSIGLEAGFNSKSTFYSTFKKLTGVTPSRFKEKHS